MRKRMLSIIPLCLLLIASAGCGGQLYKVAPLPSAAPPALPAETAPGINIGFAVLDGDQALERFEANLPLAGVIALDVRLANNTEVAIKPGALKFALRDGAGTTLKPLAPKKALSSVMKYYGNSFYLKSAYRRTLSDYQSVAFDLSREIEPRSERRGIIFFQTKRDTTNLTGLALTVTGPAGPVNVQATQPGD